MNSISKILVTTLLFLSITNTYSQISKAEIVATGLTCSMCSNAINKQLKKIADVEKVDTDLNSNTFTVYLKKGSTISPKTLKENIQKAGFFVGSMIITMRFDNQTIQENQKINGMTLIFIDAPNKIIKGETKFKILDKGYVTMKDFNKLKKTFTKYETLSTDNENDYHLKSL